MNGDLLFMLMCLILFTLIVLISVALYMWYFEIKYK